MDINADQLYKRFVEQLPLNEKLKLLELLMQSTIDLIRQEKDIKEPNNEMTELTDFQEQLLSGPVMSDEDYNFFLEKKQHFTQWK